MKELLYIPLIFSLVLTSQAQALDERSGKELVLPDGIRITVFASADDERKYFYIPRTLQLAGAEGQPEISFLLYRHGTIGPFEGGILHFLMRWGLSPAQEQMADVLLKERTDSTRVLAGAADLEMSEKDPCEIAGGSPIARLLLRSVSLPIRAPSLATQKTAASFRLNPEDAALLEETLPQPFRLKDTRFLCRYSYRVVRYLGALRVTEKREGRMEGPFAQWAGLLIKLHLLKTQTL